MELSIVICTFNRSSIIEHCLNSLIHQTYNRDNFEIIVVDNNSTDNTKNIVNEYCKKYPNFNYVFENKIGLSNARNTGYIAAKSDWVVYLDDDSKVTENFVDRAIFIIKNYRFDAFGGPVIPWHISKKKKWMSDFYGGFEINASSPQIIKKDYIFGSCLVIKKSVLFSFNGFDSSLGMNGSNIAYGEETFIQDLMRQKGFIVGYDPFLISEHLVAKYKSKIFWHIKSSYAFGRDNYIMWKKSKPTLWYLTKTIGRSFLNIPYRIRKTWLNKNYYWQNAYLDTINPIAYAFGERFAFLQTY